MRQHPNTMLTAIPGEQKKRMTLEKEVSKSADFPPCTARELSSSYSIRYSSLSKDSQAQP